MIKGNVSIIREQNICCSCGICKSLCPTNCIEYEKEKGCYVPKIDESKCVDCGICKKNCPSINNYYGDSKSVIDAMTGEYISVYNGWSKYDEIRHFSASSGVVTTLVKMLLDNNTYDVVFSVDSFNYDSQLKTQLKTKTDYINPVENNLPKSRYLSVSHENLISYIKSNKSSRVIIIGTSCALQGINNVINNFKLNRNNYLLIGLFCDKVFNYDVNKYFKDNFSKEKELIAFHFKNKDSGGWPGNMKFMFSDGSSKFISNLERGKVKEIFMPERCLYCVDKINVIADISIGDNYTEYNYTEKGSNSIVIRTNRGQEALNLAKDNLDLFEISIEDIIKAQVFENRAKNLSYAKIKEKIIFDRTNEAIVLNNGVIFDNEYVNDDEYYKLINKIKLGSEYLTNPNELNKMLKKQNKEKKAGEIKYNIRALLGRIKRKIMK